MRTDAADARDGWILRGRDRVLPAARMGAAVLVGGTIAGVGAAASAHLVWTRPLSGWCLDMLLLGASVGGAAASGLFAAMRRRREARRLGTSRSRLRDVERAHARLAAYADQLAGTLRQYRDAKAVLVRQVSEVIQATHRAAEQLAQATHRVDGTIRGLIGGLEQALTEAEDRDLEGSGKRRAVQDATRALRAYIDGRRRELALDRERVEKVRQRAEDLSRLAALVEDLADRTKVLAINASIEAARAGGHGRAFAVVAEEVHALAQQSARAAVAITEGLEAVRKAIDEEFAPKLDPRREREERELLESLADALGEIDRRGETLSRVHRTVLAEARERGRQVAERVMEAFAGLQFQDVVRQRLDQVVEALDRMVRHTEELLASAAEPEGPFPEPFRVEDLAQTYRMEPQRAAHRAALGQESPVEDGPQVEIF